MSALSSYRTLGVLAATLVFVTAGRTPAATGLPELRLNSGARGTALADAMAAVRDVDGASANPATMIASEGHSVGFSQTAWIQDMQISQLTVTGRRGEAVWGFSAELSRVDGLERRTGPTVQPLGEFGVYAGALMVSLAGQWSPRLRVGAGARLIRQSISTASATGAGVDLGALFALRPHVQAGLAVRNLGAMSSLQRTATRLPRTVRLGVSFDGLRNLRLCSEAQRPRDGDWTLHGGIEYTASPELALRLGYQTTDSRGFTGGLGLGRGSWRVDYAYVPFTYGLGFAHRLTVQLHR